MHHTTSIILPVKTIMQRKFEDESSSINNLKIYSKRLPDFMTRRIFCEKINHPFQQYDIKSLISPRLDIYVIA